MESMSDDNGVGSETVLVVNVGEVLESKFVEWEGINKKIERTSESDLVVEFIKKII